MNISLRILHTLEVGRGRILITGAPLLVFVAAIAIMYNLVIFRGLGDGDSMDTAQLARQISRGGGFTTLFIRPHALTQLSTLKASRGELEGLYPPAQYPAGVPRLLPDTYNPPLYPCLLAAWFKITKPNFGQVIGQMVEKHGYAGDKVIPPFNQLLLLATAGALFLLAMRLFDRRTAWLAMMCFLVNDYVWQFSLSALSTNLLMLLVTLALVAAVEIFRIGEESFESSTRPFWPAWGWAVTLAILLGLIALARLHFLALLVPFVVFLYWMPRSHIVLPIVVVLIAVLLTVPWFTRLERVSGSFLGSNDDILLYGETGFTGDQIYRATTISSTEMPFEAAGAKELKGFLWHFNHAWTLLGSQPLALFFVASLLHPFRRRRVQMFRWLLVGCALALVAANNLGFSEPETISPWNALAALVPGILVVGSAFFLILLDRLNLSLKLLSTSVCVVLVIISAIPMAGALASRDDQYFRYPPYIPPYIRLLGEMARVDEWTTTDMPWATAWYADRPSLWLPDSLADFEQLHDNICPTGILFITPVTLGKPALTLTSGENHDWMPLISGTAMPAQFPFAAHATSPPGGPEYFVWSDSPRWLGH